ncbi:casein kinase 1-like protein HD16 [Cynara cardunculus var. scolymus]|uniref:casein kinase 1-like protein HD16 n=1 Tax=Cynara cardunculus var. scolymus TaxID=59895 RepID=UPI000D625CD0|nr:casein kinase 1-like protein HD16 [Cynara cardunculus var. scolymus]
MYHAAQPVDQAENIIAPTQNRTRRKIDRGRGRGNVAVDAKGPSVAILVKPSAAGRGKGIRLIDSDLVPPCEIVPNTVAVGVVGPTIDDVADKHVVMGGGSAEKITGVEQEGNTTPGPEKVQVGNSYKLGVSWEQPPISLRICRF